MRKVFGLKWTGDGRILKPLYDSLSEATTKKMRLNNGMTTFHKLLSMLTGGQWVVVEMEVMEKGVDYD